MLASYQVPARGIDALLPQAIVLRSQSRQGSVDGLGAISVLVLVDLSTLYDVGHATVTNPMTLHWREDAIYVVASVIEQLCMEGDLKQGRY